MGLSTSINYKWEIFQHATFDDTGGYQKTWLKLSNKGDLIQHDPTSQLA